MKKKVLKIVASIYIVIFFLNWTIVASGQFPVLTLPIRTFDDGGSGLYVGLGYWYKLKVKMDIDYGVTVKSYNIYLLGIPIYKGIG